MKSETLKNNPSMETNPDRYVETFMAQLIARNPNEPEFHQAVREVAERRRPKSRPAPCCNR